jgi:hypothetical protein
VVRIRLLSTALELLGAVCVAWGMFLVSPALGLVVAGAFAIFIAFMIT